MPSSAAPSVPAVAPPPVDTPFLALSDGRNDDPFALLGPHRDGDRVVIRTIQPSALEVEIRMDGTWQAMRRRQEPGLFEYAGHLSPGDPLPDYRLRVTHSRTWATEIDDPYRYGQVFSGFDLHLFGEGTLNRAFERFGAHRVRVGLATGVHFAVWAPNAQRVSVVGDFNGWDGRVHPMRRLLPSGVWELFIPDLADGEKYKFEIRTPEGWLLKKTDPFGTYFEVPPQTAAVVRDIRGYEWGDGEWMTSRAARREWHDEPMTLRTQQQMARPA